MQLLELAFVLTPGSPLARPEYQNHFRCRGWLSAKNQCTLTLTSSTDEIAPKPRVGLTAAHALTAKHPQSRSKLLPNLTPRHFINLTNGIEALPDMSSLVPASELRFIRIQSSHCESCAYDKLLNSLDNELLFSLACGRDCYVYDFASRNKSHGIPRALFMGLEFVKWSVSYLWFTDDSDALPEKAFVRGKNTVPFWRDQVLPYKISKDTKKKVRYFAAFAKEMGVRDVKLHGVYGRVSEIDGCKDIHVKLVRDWLQEQLSDGADDDDEMDTVGNWISSRGYAQFKADCTGEELVSIQEWMTGFRKDV